MHQESCVFHVPYTNNYYHKIPTFYNPLFCICIHILFRPRRFSYSYIPNEPLLEWDYSNELWLACLDLPGTHVDIYKIKLKSGLLVGHRK
jgi:hypothetical protein